MRFHFDFRISDSGRLTIAFLFSFVLHALLLILVRFAQPGWNSASTVTTTLNVRLEKHASAALPPAGIPAATLKSKGKAKVGVETTAPVPAPTPAPQEMRPTVTLVPTEQRKPEPPRSSSEEKILALEKPAKFAVPESAPELPVTKSVPPEIVEEKAKPPVPVPVPAPSVEHQAEKTPAPVEEPRKLVAVEPAPEKQAPEKQAVEQPPAHVVEPAEVEEPKPVKVEPQPVKIEEPKPVKVEEPKPPKIEEPRPVKIEEPKAVKAEESQPAKVEPVPPKVEEPKPARIEEPKPSSIEEPRPLQREVAVAPRASVFAVGKPSTGLAGTPGTAPVQSEFGAGGIRGLPRITDRKVFGERRKVVDSKEQELRYIMYRESVYLKLKRIGQFNYPAGAPKGQNGRVAIQFSVRADGSVDEIGIVNPSPYQVFNAAAEKIVRLCAPFSPLPDSIRQDTDVLVFRIRWNFEDSRQTFE